MKESSKDEIAGKVHETKGAIKEKVGRATNNADLEDEGTGEKIAGKIQKKVGQVEKVIEKPGGCDSARLTSPYGTTRMICVSSTLNANAPKEM